MCGITGYTGKKEALPFLMQGLSKLEYRGYDSAGVTLIDPEGPKTLKTKGRLSELEKLVSRKTMKQHCGIGHTRWATHGIPSNLNAHPHQNAEGTISLVHNGIIENYASLKEELIKEGYEFQSDTDSEVVVLLLDKYYKEGKDLFKALKKTLRRLTGSWALCIVSSYEPDTIYLAKKESPMIVGRNEEGSFCASDAPALLSYSRDILPLSDGDMAILRPDSLKVYDAKGKEKAIEFITFPYDLQTAQKGGYDSYMRKEIFEQPNVVRETLRGRFRGNKIQMDELDGLAYEWKDIREVIFIACGTAYHACLYAAELMKRWGIYSYAQPASEFRYGDPILDDKTVCVFVSQSGETADTLAALKLAKSRHALCIGISNVLGSSVARLSDAVLYTSAGLEIAVASTKAYTTQLVLLYLLTVKIAELSGRKVKGRERRIKELKAMPEAMAEVLKADKEIKKLASYLIDQRDAYFIGRQLDYPSALEGALKLKEVSYVHADAYYGGELKHGPIALIEKGSVVVALATQPNVAAKTISNIEETIARGAEVILITSKDMEAEGFSHVLRLPDISPDLAPVVSILYLQLFAYWSAKLRGCDIDKPRNLAKSVTVE